MTASVTHVNPESTPDIIDQIKELRKQSLRNESEAAKLNIKLGALFIRLKAKAPSRWGAKLQRLGYSPRVVSRLTKAATRLAAADGTVSQGLLDRLPGDPIKLEALCALPLADVERIVIEHDCRQLDRTEVAALVREQTGKKAASEKKSLSPTEAIRASWAQSVEALLKKIDKIESENEREELIEHLEESLDDLKEALHEVEDEGTESEGQDGEHEAADLADQERDEDAVDSHGKESAEKDETEAKPVRAHEVPRPQKADRPAGGRPVGRPRAKAQPA